MGKDFRKMVLMGAKYESTVKLADYGGVEVRVHALPDLVLTQIEERTGETAFGVMRAIESARKGLIKKFSKYFDDKGQIKADLPGETLLEISDEMAKLYTPSMKRFFAEVAKRGMILDPDPECEKCKGKDADCPVCGPGAVVDNLRGGAVAEIGTEILGVSLADWSKVEDFFLPKKGQSGPE